MNLEGDRDKQTSLDKIWTRVLGLDRKQAKEFEGERLPIHGLEAGAKKRGLVDIL